MNKIYFIYRCCMCYVGEKPMPDKMKKENKNTFEIGDNDKNVIEHPQNDKENSNKTKDKDEVEDGDW